MPTQYTMRECNRAENTKSDKLNKDRITAQTWLAALDWMLGQSDEAYSKLPGSGEIK